MSALQTLKPGLDTFRHTFNASAHLPRFLTVTSPTCEACLRGARTVRTELLESMALGADSVQFIVVWINMLQADDWVAATRAAAIFDPFAHVAQFHDPHQRIGQALAAALGAPEQIAWDFYVCFRPGIHWLNEPPRPHEWLHQLGQQEWPDPGRYRWQDDLGPALRQAMAELLAAGSPRE